MTARASFSRTRDSQRAQGLSAPTRSLYSHAHDNEPTMKMSPVTSTAAHAALAGSSSSGVWPAQPGSPDALATWKHDAAALASAWQEDAPPAHAAASTWLDALPPADASLAIRRSSATMDPPPPVPRSNPRSSHHSGPRATVSSSAGMAALRPNSTISPDGTLMPWGDAPTPSRRGTILTAFAFAIVALLIAGFGLAWTAESVAVAARVAHVPAPGVRHLQLVNSGETKREPAPVSSRLAHRARVISSRSSSSDEVGGEGLAD